MFALFYEGPNCDQKDRRNGKREVQLQIEGNGRIDYVVQRLDNSRHRMKIMELRPLSERDLSSKQEVGETLLQERIEPTLSIVYREKIDYPIETK